MSPPLNDEQANRVARHTELVARVARSIVRQVDVLPYEELESVGNEALVQAAMRYDPSSTASFATFAHYRVRGAMIDALRKATPGRRKYKRAVIRLEAMQALLAQAAEDQDALAAGGRRQTLEQRVEAARALVRRASLAISLSEPDRWAGDDDVPAEDPDPEQLMVAVDALDQLRTAVETLEPEQRALLEALYDEGVPMRDIAKQWGTSVATVSRRHAKLLDLLGERARALAR
jgi:RNA polymerase sigma factor for flagellar operon FliA